MTSPPSSPYPDLDGERDQPDEQREASDMKVRMAPSAASANPEATSGAGVMALNLDPPPARRMQPKTRPAPAVRPGRGACASPNWRFRTMNETTQWRTAEQRAADNRELVEWCNANLDPETWWKCFPALVHMAAKP